MSTKTREEILARLLKKYEQSRAGYRSIGIDQAVPLLGYRKSAIRALKVKVENRAAGVRTGRPKTYHRDTMIEQLRDIEDSLPFNVSAPLRDFIFPISATHPLIHIRAPSMQTCCRSLGQAGGEWLDFSLA